MPAGARFGRMDTDRGLGEKGENFDHESVASVTLTVSHANHAASLRRKLFARRASRRVLEATGRVRSGSVVILKRIVNLATILKLKSPDVQPWSAKDVIAFAVRRLKLTNN